MLQKLYSLLGSWTKALDILYVHEGVKPCCRVLDVDGLSDILKEMKLSYETSDFGVEMQKNVGGSYTDKGKSVKEGGRRVLYVSKDAQSAKEAKQAESEQNHKRLGLLLGYPCCCVEFFQEHAEKEEESDFDLTVNVAAASVGVKHPWHTNTCLRGFDVNLLSHFPCSFQCEQSKEIAEKNLAIIKKHESDLAQYFVHALQCALIYARGVGVYSFKRAAMDRNIMVYDSRHLVSSSKNSFHDLLIRENKIALLGKQHFLVGKTKVQDDQTFFALFS